MHEWIQVKFVICMIYQISEWVARVVRRLSRI